MLNSSIRRLRALFAPAANDNISAFGDLELDIFRSHDQESNARTSLPDDESIDLHCVWGVEFYGPSYVETLIQSFRDLDWFARHQDNPRRDPAVWLRDLHRHRAGGSFMNLGILTHPGSDSYWASSTTEAPLPSCVALARVNMYSWSASLIAIVTCFVLKEERSNILNSILLDQPQTITRPTKHGVSIHDPILQKMENIGRVRKDLASAVAQWYQDNLPGQFSSNIHGGDLPTCEFLTTRKAIPFSPILERSHSGFSYLNLLELDRSFNVWRNDNVTGLWFRESSSSRYHSMIAARERDVVSSMSEHYDSEDRIARIFYIDDAVGSVVLTRASLTLLDDHAQNILKVRDVDLSRIGTSKGAVRHLDDLTKNILYSADVSSVVAEIPQAVQSGFGPFNGASSFFSTEDYLERPRVSYAEHCHMVARDQALWLRNLEEAFRTYSTQIGALLGTRESVRLQRYMIWMTIALLVLAVVTAMIAVVNG